MKSFVTTYFLLIVLVLAVVFAFAMKATVFQKKPDAKTKPVDTLSSAFNSYWFTKKGEVNTYELEQAQDGGLHKGEAILVFSTPDFRTDTQVETKSSGPTTIPVLKTILSKTFPTKLMTYSLLSAVFTPINTATDQPSIFPNTLKVSTSSQTQAGHSYWQVNYKNNEYQVSGRSYQEQEASEDYHVAKALLEDELWNRIRLNPDKLPTGEIQLIPGTMSARLRHRPINVLPAKATVADYEGILYPGTKLKSYTLEYNTDDRTLIIIFENQFPYKIVGWEETYDTKATLLTSRAVLKQSVQSNDTRPNASIDSTLSLKP